MSNKNQTLLPAFVVSLIVDAIFFGGFFGLNDSIGTVFFDMGLSILFTTVILALLFVALRKQIWERRESVFLASFCLNVAAAKATLVFCMFFSFLVAQHVAGRLDDAEMAQHAVFLKWFSLIFIVTAGSYVRRIRQHFSGTWKHLYVPPFVVVVVQISLTLTPIWVVLFLLPIN